MAKKYSSASSTIIAMTHPKEIINGKGSIVNWSQ